MNGEISYLDTKMAKSAPPKGELITDLSELSRIMGAVSLAAAESNYWNAAYGFYMYRVVTDIVHEWIRHERFLDNDKMARTVPTFADLAFDPLREEGPWGYFYTNPAAINAHPVISAMDFMTDHVEEDLGYALHLTRTEESHRHDYFTSMNSIFNIAIDKVTPHLADISPVYKKLGVQKTGTTVAKRKLYSSRDYAFNVARLEYRDAMSQDEIENVRIRHRHSSERHMPSQSRFSRFVINTVVGQPTPLWQAA